MNLTSTSKFVSLILRHKPETIGIQLDEHGWANVDELIAGISKTRKFNREILEEIFGQIISKDLPLMKIKQRFGQIRDIRFLLM